MTDNKVIFRCSSSLHSDTTVELGDTFLLLCSLLLLFIAINNNCAWSLTICTIFSLFLGCGFESNQREHDESYLDSRLSEQTLPPFWQNWDARLVLRLLSYNMVVHDFNSILPHVDMSGRPTLGLPATRLPPILPNYHHYYQITTTVTSNRTCVVVIYAAP